MHTVREITVQVDGVLRLIAAAGHSTHQRPPSRIADHVLTRVIHHSYGQALDGMLAHAVREGILPVSVTQRGMVARHHRNVMERVLRMEQRMIGLCDEFARLGIDYRLLKGIALAHGVYPDPSMRSFGDVDILLRPADFERAVDAVISLGGTRRIPPFSRDGDATFTKDVSIALDGVSFDLHRRLIDGPFGQVVAVEQMFNRHRTVELGGRLLQTLDLADLFLHAGLTAGAADVPPRLITLRDLMELERQPAFDRDLIIERAFEWGVGSALARGLRLLDDQLRPDRPSSLHRWACELRASTRDRMILGSYLGAQRTVRQRLVTLMVLPNWRSRWSLMRSTLVPDRAYLDARSWSRLDYLRFGLRRLRR